MRGNHRRNPGDGEAALARADSPRAAGRTHRARPAGTSMWLGLWIGLDSHAPGSLFRSLLVWTRHLDTRRLDNTFTGRAGIHFRPPSSIRIKLYMVLAGDMTVAPVGATLPACSLPLPRTSDADSICLGY